MKYILASASPRRKELMTQAGFSFEVVPSQVEETISQTRPSDIVTELSSQKALEVYERLQPKDCTVIGADTIVVYRDEILGKPADEAEALDMLSLLAGRTHQVYTGVTLFSGGRTATEHEATSVRFRPLSQGDIDHYLATGEPMDKAGAYGIQGYGSVLIEGISGDYYNVMGLPVCRLGRMLARFGVEPLALAAEKEQTP